ncbi:hypothetical protein BK120_08240 [Paenibacillus sp. FSL A5-0031]|nr:hypothetical protein BK120_08240 [Paenibacillus sp. FSL A5-0031]
MNHFVEVALLFFCWMVICIHNKNITLKMLCQVAFSAGRNFCVKYTVDKHGIVTFLDETLVVIERTYSEINDKSPLHTKTA